MSDVDLTTATDKDVIKAYEDASERFDEDGMAAALEEMKRRNLDF